MQGSLSGCPVMRSRQCSGLWGTKGEPKLLHGTARGIVVGNTRARASPGVQNRRVVAPTEVTADGRQRLARQLAGKIHGHLARPGDTGSPGGGEELLA